MRKIFRLFFSFSLILFLLPAAVQAQQRTVTGTILSDDNKTPLAGVTVKVKGSRRITQTDANGKFSIVASAGETLQVTYVGYENYDIKLGDGDTVGINLKAADNMLGEVVVTAMDIKRNPRSLGYSVQKVSGADIQETQRENFINSLQGRVAGLSITQTGGTAGASSNIVLRGFNSLAGANQPLFIIDGIIIDNQTLGENSDQGAGLGLASDRPNRNNDYANRIGDINPNDIESVTVLKGPEATALYGSQANAGAIVITTKKGTSNDGKITVNYDNSFRFQKIIRTPDILTKYGPGSNGISDDVFSYFGPQYPAGTKFYDNIGAFFKTGFAQTHNLSVEYGKKDITFRLSGSFYDQQSIIPENRYKRINLRLTNSTKIGKWVTFTPSFSIISSNNDKPLRGSGGYLLTLLQWPADNDVRNYQNSAGDKIDLFPGGDPNDEQDNPLFNVKYNRGNDDLNRYIATAGINITPFKWLTVAGRFGYDWYQQDGYVFYHPQSNFYSVSTGGALDNYYRKYTGYNHTINATAKKTFFRKLNTSLMAGTMWQDYKTAMRAVFGTGLVDLNKTDSNNTNPATRRRLSREVLFGDANYIQSRQFAYFGEVGVNWNNLVFFNYTRRWEQSSTLPEVNRNYNYPGASLSIILSDIFPVLKKGNILNFAKLRSSLAQTARGTSPYSNQSVFGPVTSSGQGFSYGFTNNNFLLGPERQKTYEIGTELRFLKSRLSIDFAYYRTKNTDQIVELFRASYGTGFILNTLNAASTLNKGYELTVTGTILKAKNAIWDVTINFNKTTNKVLSLPANVPEFYISDTWLYGNARGGLITGGPTSSITSYGYQRNNNGDVLINPATGLPFIESLFKVRGDRNPDFTTGILQTLKIKNWKFSMLWDLKVGGDIFNGTEMYLTRIGRSNRVSDREKPLVVTGVLKDGLENSATPTPNTVSIIPLYRTDYYTTLPEEEYIQKDVNWFRLRDLTISYTFDKSKIANMNFIKSLSVFATGNDLILLTNYFGQDPSVNGNTPASKGVGGIGFDFGNIGTPASFNIGFRLGL